WCPRLRLPVSAGRTNAGPAHAKAWGPSAAPDQQGRPGLLDRLGLDARPPHEVEGALEGHFVLRPQRVEALDELVESLPALRPRRAGRVVLGPRPADAQTDREAALGHHVEGGELLGEHARGIEWRDEHAGPE